MKGIVKYDESTICLSRQDGGPKAFIRLYRGKFGRIVSDEKDFDYGITTNDGMLNENVMMIDSFWV